MLRLLAQREEGYEDIGALMGLSDDEVRSKVKDALAALERGDPGDDQKAMLRLLAQREEGYGDIGALMGLSDGEVRSKVRASLAELEGESPPPPAPTAGPRPPLRTPEPARAPERPKAKPAPAKSPLQNKRLLAQVGGCVAIVLLLVLFASGVIDVGGSDDGDSGGSETTPTAVNPTSNSKVPTQAILKGVDGSDAEGRAIFGQAQRPGPARRRRQRAGALAAGQLLRDLARPLLRRTDPDRRDQGGEGGDDQRPVPGPGDGALPARQRL